MTIKTHIEGFELISVRVPEGLMRDVRILLLDPTTGQIGYGRLKNLIIKLLANWLEEKKKGIDEVVLGETPKDKFEPFDNEGE